MAFHLPIVAAAAVGVGLVRGVAAAANGEKGAFQKGLNASLSTAKFVTTFGLATPRSGLDFQDNGCVSYDPDGSCLKDSRNT